MAKQVLNIGLTPNDGTGDTLRIGGDKIQDNFDDLYLALGAGTSPTGSVKIAIPDTGNTTGQVLKFDGTNYVPSTDINTNTTYAVSAETGTGGVNIRLSGSDATTDDLLLFAGTGLTIVRTDPSTITLTNTVSNTTYNVSVESIVAGTKTLRLTGSNATIDDITVTQGTGITLSSASTSEMTITADMHKVNDQVGEVWTYPYYQFGGAGPTDYTVYGDGFPTAGVADPDIYVYRGHTYRFKNLIPSEIVEILDSSNVAPAADYISSTGTTRNEADQDEYILFKIPQNATPGNAFKYRSKTNPLAMTGNIVVV